MLKLDIETIRRYIYARKIKAYKIGQVWRIKETDLNEFIEKGSSKEE